MNIEWVAVFIQLDCDEVVYIEGVKGRRRDRKKIVD